MLINDPIAPVAHVTLGSETYDLLFDMNTFAAFEQKTGKNFFKVLMSVIEVVKASTVTDKDGSPKLTDPFALITAVPVGDLQALLWAAIHTYVKKEPVWPLTIGQVGMLIHIGNVVDVFNELLTGQLKNLPTDSELAAAGETQGVAENEGPVRVTPLKKTTGKAGGLASGKLLE